MSEIVKIFGPANTTPTTIHCMVTNKCSLGCPECYYRHDSKAEWSITFATGVLSQAREMNVEWLALGGGEPMEWTHMAEFMDHTRYIRIPAISVTTNGVNLPELPFDAVHVSHDYMHCPPNMNWEDREAQVLKALYHWGRLMNVKELGLNCRVDQGEVAEQILAQSEVSVDTVVLVLPKPYRSLDKDINVNKARIFTERLHKFYPEMQVCVDSCLAQLMGIRCCQGRCSMSINQNGMFSVCSNVGFCYKLYTVDGDPDKCLINAWKHISSNTCELPEGCIVKEK